MTCLRQGSSLAREVADVELYDPRHLNRAKGAMAAKISIRVWLIMETLLGATSMTASHKAGTIGSARQIHRFACWIGAGILFVGLLPACASSEDYDFKPSGIGRGQDAAYSKPVGGLYDYEGTPTPTPGGS